MALKTVKIEPGAPAQPEAPQTTATEDRRSGGRL